MSEDAATHEAPAVASDSLITDAKPALDFSLGKPEGFPDEFWDAEKKVPVVDKLFDSYTQQKLRADGLRVKLSKGEFEGKPPEDIKEYVLELSDELKPLVPEDDRLFNTARQAAKDAGLPKEAFAKFMLPIITEMAKAKAEHEAPATPEEIEADRIAKVEKLGPSGHKIVDAVGSFITQLQARGTFSEQEAVAAKNMVFDADSAKVMNKLRMMAGDSSQVPVDVPIESGASRQDVETKMAAAMMANNEAEYTKYSNMLSRMNA